MEHILKDLEITETSEQDLKALEGDGEAMQRILEGQVVYFRQIGDYSLIKGSHHILTSDAGVIFLQFQEETSDQIQVLMSGYESLYFAIDIVSIIDILLKLHDLFGCVEMAVYTQRTIAIDE